MRSLCFLPPAEIRCQMEVFAETDTSRLVKTRCPSNEIEGVYYLGLSDRVGDLEGVWGDGAQRIVEHGSHWRVMLGKSSGGYRG